MGNKKFGFLKDKPAEGLEPSTLGLQIPRSAY